MVSKSLVGCSIFMRQVISLKPAAIRVVMSRWFFFSSRRRHTRLQGDWSSDVCSSDLDDAHRHRYETAISSDPLEKPVEVDPARDVAVLAPTGGTTASPKAVMLSHRNLVDRKSVV